MTLRIDTFRLRPAYKTPDGYLICTGRAARAGALPYRNGDGSIRRELVLPEELQREDSLGSVALKPVTDKHPPAGRVTADNARDLQRGFSLQKVRYAGGYVEIEILITDAELVAKVERGDAREISLGYDLENLEVAPGVHPEFGEYDAIQRGRICNHVAVVPRGRAGSSVAIRVDSEDPDRAWFREDETTISNHEDFMKKEKAEIVAVAEVAAEEPEKREDTAPANLGESVDQLAKAARAVAVVLAEHRTDAKKGDEEEETTDPLQQVADAMVGFVEQLDAMKAHADQIQAQYDERKGQLDALMAEFQKRDQEHHQHEDIMSEKEKQDRTDAASGLTEADMLKWHAERKRLETAASGYRVDGVEGLGNAELRRKIVETHFGEPRADASDEEIKGAFAVIEQIQARREDSYTRASERVIQGRQDSAKPADVSAAERYRAQLLSGYRSDADPRRDLADRIAKALTE